LKDFVSRRMIRKRKRELARKWRKRSKSLTGKGGKDTDLGDIPNKEDGRNRQNCIKKGLREEKKPFGQDGGGEGGESKRKELGT